MSYYKHESSFVDANCQIGDNTRIWHFSHIMKNVVIGTNCVLGQNCHIASGVSIGSNVKIQNNVSIYTGTIIEDDVFLGPSCVLTNVTNPRAQINRHNLYEQTLLKRGCTIGANATVVCGVTIGRYAFIAAGAVVTRCVPDYALIVGVPGVRKGWMSRHGLPLPEPDESGIMVCPESGFRYKLLENEQICCLDLDEESPLPVELTTGRKTYDDYKR